MRRKTASQNRKRGQASSQAEGGLIVNGREEADRSAGDECALDDRSHRTPKFSRMRRRRNSVPTPQPGAACRLQRYVRHGGITT
jgi:hypothetical protein